MKQIITLALVLAYTLVGYGQTFKNKPLISKRTADWCPNCGNWGWQFKLKILEEIGADEATVVAVHHSGDLSNPTSKAITDALGGVSQPRFYLNNQDLGASSGNWNSKIDELKQSVADINAEIPDFGIELHGYFGSETNEVVAEINLHVNQAVEGEYYLGAYLVTNNLVHDQAGAAGADAEHKKILLDAFTDEAFGTLIGNGPILEGVSNFDISKVFEDVPEGPTDVVVVVWKNDDGFKVVNTAVIENVDQLSTVDDVSWLNESNLSFSNDQINISLDSEKSIGEYRLNVYSTSGYLVHTEKNYTADEFLYKSIDTDQMITGSYIINIISSKGAWTEQVIVNK